MKNTKLLTLGAFLASTVALHYHFIEQPNMAPRTNAPGLNDDTTAPSDTTTQTLYHDNHEDALLLHQQEFFRNTGISADNGHLGLTP